MMDGQTAYILPPIFDYPEFFIGNLLNCQITKYRELFAPPI